MAPHSDRASDAPPPYDTIVFDCDSTLSRIEGIEELVGDHPEIAALTRAAMDGEVPLESVYGRRLELSRPSHGDMQRVADLYVRHALPNARALVGALHALGKRVHIVSGGLLPAVAPFGAWLGIPTDRIQAVDLRFDDDGAYSGFDDASPLARAGGKIEVVGRIAESGGRLALIGDGATDLEAACCVQRFVAYGGVERRPAVAAGAAVHCDEEDFAALLPLLVSDEERAHLATLSAHRELLPDPASPPHRPR